MCIQATERAKGASDMSLSEHNFCSIVPTAEKGRTIYSGIQEFVAFISCSSCISWHFDRVCMEGKDLA